MQTIAANESPFRGFLSGIKRSFRRRTEKFKGVPLAVAEGIMGKNIHSMQDARAVFRYDEEFFSTNEHLMFVPYTEEELDWAVQSEVVLTIHSLSPQRIVRVAPEAVGFTDSAWDACTELVRQHPRRAEWRLFMRTRMRYEEDRALLTRPSSLKDTVREHIPSLGLALSAMVIDFKMRGVRPPLYAGPRLTRSTIDDKERGTVRKRVWVQGGLLESHPIRFIVADSEAKCPPPLVAWKPHRID